MLLSLDTGQASCDGSWAETHGKLQGAIEGANFTIRNIRVT